MGHSKSLWPRRGRVLTQAFASCNIMESASEAPGRGTDLARGTHRSGQFPARYSGVARREEGHPSTRERCTIQVQRSTILKGDAPVSESQEHLARLSQQPKQVKPLLAKRESAREIGSASYPLRQPPLSTPEPPRAQTRRGRIAGSSAEASPFIRTDRVHAPI